MDRNPWVSALIVLLNLMHYISGVMMKPENVTLHIWEGNVTVTWDPPEKNPVGCVYQVQMTDYSETPVVWKNLSNCSLLKASVCNIGHLSSDSDFHVRVGVVMPQGSISWSVRKYINVRRSQLLPPSFNLLSTPFSVQVKVHRKDELKDIFPYGLEYTASLWPVGQENQTQTGDDSDDDGEIEFNFLRPWQVYCVRVWVKTGASSSSSEQCIQLPLDMTLIICFVFFGLLGFVAVLMLFVCCFLRRPRKMPGALKPVVNKWQPMTVGSVEVETVTDKGWLLITNKKEEKMHISEEKIEFTEEEKDRRESLDSGVSMEQLHPSVSNTRTEGQTEDIQEDSGCESLKGAEGSGSVRKASGEHLSLDEISHDGRSEGREDSGLGLSHREVSSSLEGEDSGLLSEVVVGDGYRSQSPSSVDMKNETPEPCDMDTNMASPSGGYRSGQVTCVCSDHEYCVWCKFKKPLTEDCQSVTPMQTNFSQTICDTDDANSVITSYRKKNLIQTVNLLGLEDTQSVFPQSDMSTETSLLLFSCPLLLQSGKNQDCITDTFFLTG
ncbi:interleukin-10 receptor subunit alpha [Colossoma macropomum]|uniref:interleukin-10 receptor subunit alpha n=1 Tax=Colossoma macropomum TaxID=42526 RepID=UPI00186456D7|nr:interleukin-10 receptor subunit alpha [Colossoma macropomum]